MTDAENIHRRIKLSMAEAAVVQEQVDLLRDAAEALKGAVFANNGHEMAKSWTAMSDSMNYLGALMNLKGYAAMREYAEEEEG